MTISSGFSHWKLWFSHIFHSYFDITRGSWIYRPPGTISHSLQQFFTGESWTYDELSRVTTNQYIMYWDDPLKHNLSVISHEKHLKSLKKNTEQLKRVNCLPNSLYPQPSRGKNINRVVHIDRTMLGTTAQIHCSQSPLPHQCTLDGKETHRERNINC